MLNCVNGSTKLEKQKKAEKKLRPVFRINGISSTLITPVQFAKHHDIVAPLLVTLTDTQEGILIKKARIED